MRLSLYRAGLFLLIAASAFWIGGYLLAVKPFLADGIRDRDLGFLDYPSVKFYRLADEETGKMSAVKVDFFSIADGPTGVEFTQAWFPCWIVSLVALGVIMGCAKALFSGDR